MNLKKGPCSNDSFKCSDDTCIDTKLICDGKRNCINSEDETSCRQLLLVNKNKDQGIQNIKLQNINFI